LLESVELNLVAERVHEIVETHLWKMNKVESEKGRWGEGER
jgi:hypothetical protein